MTGRRALKPDDLLFADGDAAREAAAAAAAAAQPAAAAAAATAAAALPAPLTHAHTCATCGRHLATAALLFAHVEEAHDAFFAARAARGDAVFSCPLPGCGHPPFTSVAARAAHATDVHGVSRADLAAALGVRGGGGALSRGGGWRRRRSRRAGGRPGPRVVWQAAGEGAGEARAVIRSSVCVRKRTRRRKIETRATG